MRRVPLSKLTPDMKLGRSVCYGKSVLIREGTVNLNRFVKRLKNLGIHSLYIEDAACKGIDTEDVVSDNIRHKCKESLGHTMKKMRTDYAVSRVDVTKLAENLLEEVMSHSNTLVSLSDIGNVDESTLDHSINTTIYAICLGLQLDFGKQELLELAEGTLLHDIGKIILDKRILFKADALDQEEFEYIKTHTLLGYDLLKKMPGLSERSRQIALCHHERLDGSGYPNGLSGKEISTFARIVAIVDVYEALTADRCYHKAVTPCRALEILSEETVSKLDLPLATKFMQNIAVYPNGTVVYLSNGTWAVVKSQNQSMPLRPVVRVISVKNGVQIPGDELDLMKVLNITITDKNYE